MLRICVTVCNTLFGYNYIICKEVKGHFMIFFGKTIIFHQPHNATPSKPILLMGVKKILEKILKSIFGGFPGTLDPPIYTHDCVPGST